MQIYSNRAQKHITFKYKIDVLSQVTSAHTNHFLFPICSWWAAELVEHYNLGTWELEFTQPVFFMAL